MAIRRRAPASPPPWTSLWLVVLISLLAQLALCQFFSFGDRVPLSLDVDPSNLWKYAYQFPPSGEFLVLNWLGVANLPPPLNPFSLGAHLPPWLFFTAYTPVMATLALLAMAAFLRELELPRPAALFGGLVFAWQGDLLPFVFPGHYGYIATWPFYALAAWGALRSQRTGSWPYALISGVSCGIMVGLQPDRGALASLLVAALYLAPAWKYRPTWLRQLRSLALCAGLALLVSLAAFFALFQSFIVGVNMGGTTTPDDTYKFDTQFSLGPEETLTYLVPGFFGWHSSDADGLYWGRIGQPSDWKPGSGGPGNLNLAISTIGTIPTALTLLAALFLLPGPIGRLFGPVNITERQLFFGRLLLGLSALALLLSWGYHTPFYRMLFALPLMDKWRNPLKWLEITNFAWVTLSAFGLQHLLGFLNQPESPQSARSCRRARIFLEGMGLLLGLGLIFSFVLVPSLVLKFQADGFESEAIPGMVSTLHESLFIAMVLLGLACVLLRMTRNPDRLCAWNLENPWLNRLWKNILQPIRLPLTLTLGLALLSTVQLGWVANQFIWPTNIYDLTETNPLVEQLKSEGNIVRVSVTPQDPTLYKLLQNQFITPEISCLEISAASRMPDTLSAFLGDFTGNPSRLWLLAGVKNRVVPQADFNELQSDPRIKANIDHVDGYSLAPTMNQNLPSHALVQLRDYLAKATLIPAAEITPSDEQQLARLRDPNWNPRATVLLHGPPAAPPAAPMPAPGPARVNLSIYNSREMEMTVDAPTGGFVLINDAYDPDWQVQLNGRPAPLLRADFLLRAIDVPVGESTVSLRYVAHYHVGGMDLPAEATNEFCDLAMLAIWVVAGIGLWRRRSPPVSDEAAGSGENF